MYRPWCPTKLDDALNVLEWGDCMEDCAMEVVNSACLNDPEFPQFSDGTGVAVNYTTDFILGYGAVVDEEASAGLQTNHLPPL